MPKVNLRLTEEELEQLQRWAESGRRSLQKEIVYRLFRERSVDNVITVGPSPFVEPVNVDAQPRDVPTRTIAPTPYEREFKPDFKPTKVPKKKGR